MLMRLSEVQFGRNQVRVGSYEIVLLDLNSNRKQIEDYSSQFESNIFLLVMLIRSNYSWMPFLI